jgi:hypothetical protein
MKPNTGVHIYLTNKDFNLYLPAETAKEIKMWFESTVSNYKFSLVCNELTYVFDKSHVCAIVITPPESIERERELMKAIWGDKLR